MSNPLLSDRALPPFSQIETDAMEPALRRVIDENEAAISTLLDMDEEPSWANLIQVLDNLEDRLGKLWSTISHLFGVNNNEALREVYQRCLPLLTEYSTNLSQNEALYERIDSLRNRAEELSLTDSQIKVLDDYLLDFRLAGVTLEPTEKARFKELEKQLSQLSTRFSNNVLDATHAWTKHITDESLLEGLPESALDTAREAAGQKGLDGYLLTLDFPCYLAVTTYADNEALRRELYTAYVTRASDQAEGRAELDNSPVIDEILSLRHEKARLVGFDNYAQLSLANKMAESPEKVLGFLNELVEKGRPEAQRELQELKACAASLGRNQLQAWDIPYYSEKLRQRRYDISQEELRAFFPITRVKAGLFRIVGQLYGVEIRSNREYETWHPSVEACDLFRNGELIARCFLDLYTRDSKRGGAWMAECRSRRELDDGSIQLPAAYLVCNFSAGREGRPALLTHNEVTTLFHEFGHGLHHLLTRESALRVSGINGVAWDAVELPSQLMENWCWNPESLRLISGHYESGEPLPEAMLEKMLAARNFQVGMKMLRQLEFGLFDFELHVNLESSGAGYVRDTMNTVKQKTSVYETPDFNRFENSFSHIFAGGYAAGYYSYYWAEVLSADVFSRFDASGVLDSATGNRFLQKVLSRGGAVKALTLFMDFMGREPSIEALLVQKGIASA